MESVKYECHIMSIPLLLAEALIQCHCLAWGTGCGSQFWDQGSYPHAPARLKSSTQLLGPKSGWPEIFMIMSPAICGSLYSANLNPLDYYIWGVVETNQPCPRVIFYWLCFSIYHNYWIYCISIQMKLQLNFGPKFSVYNVQFNLWI